MAGMKGKSGGPRTNSGGPRANSGGARPGAGRKRKEPAILVLASTYDEPEKFLNAVMNDSGTEAKLRIDAAKALLSAKVRRAENGGKKEAKDEAAKKVGASSRFASQKPPGKVVPLHRSDESK